MEVRRYIEVVLNFRPKSIFAPFRMIFKPAEGDIGVPMVRKAGLKSAVRGLKAQESKFQNNLIIAGLISVLFIGSLYGQWDVKPRVSGLERDSVYMSLLVREHALKKSEDSLNSAIAFLRERFATQTAGREELGERLVGLEARLFEVKTQIGRVVSQAGAIEQRAILDNMGFAQPATTPSAGSVVKYSSLDDFFRKNLSPDEFSQLMNYRQSEPKIRDLTTQYTRLYHEMSRISSAYAAAATPRETDSLYNDYLLSRDNMHDAEERLGTIWVDEMSNSTYIYSLLLDKLDRLDEIEALYQKGLKAKVGEDSVMSVPFAEYPLQKSLLLSYELSLATIAGVGKETIDSLNFARIRVEQEPLSFPPIMLRQRDFVDYTPVTVTDPSVYNSSNPIPTLSIPDYGTYYGVTVGTFSSAQPVSLFHGANPIYVERLGNRQYRYYAGLYRTFGEAMEGTAMLVRAGFRRPEVVVWREGKYENIAQAAAQNNGLFNVRIKGVEGEPGRGVKSAIEKYARGKDVTRSGGTLGVGIFDNRLHAAELAEALAKSGVQASIEEITE